MTAPIRGFSKLHRLTRERLQRSGALDTVPDEPIPYAPIATIAPPTRQGGESQHPQWFQVRAIVTNAAGQLDAVFLAEYPKPHQAVLAASAYPFRAVVINKHSKQEFSNGKPIKDDRR